MDTISIRYGETPSIYIDTGDVTAISATMYVGLPGEAPKITVPTTLTDGVGSFDFSAVDTSIPLGTYKYQITVLLADNKIEKYPEPKNCDSCEDNLPDFVVCEALDETEVVS